MPKLIIIIISIITRDHATTTFNVTIIESAIMSNNLPPECPELDRRCLKMFIAYFISLIINIASKL